MIPYWVFAVLILTHIGLFALGAVAYHGIRMLAMRPVFSQPQQRQRMSEAQMLAAASKIAAKQATDAAFGHLNPWSDVQVPPREQIIPEGDGRPQREEAFAPMTAKK